MKKNNVIVLICCLLMVCNSRLVSKEVEKRDGNSLCYIVAVKGSEEALSTNYRKKSKVEVIKLNFKGACSFNVVEGKPQLIPLETTDESLIAEIDCLWYYKNRYYVLDKSQYSVFCFDKKTKKLFSVEGSEFNSLNLYATSS